ncbi:MAG: hypothetical protein H6617_08750 [Bdellovibrionaceae bacterium]|nr:hypothetical protein [Bdellovibrionales bacterium]MCB9254755.1 hypothetical protein [Pseudobdellovibrionaceae bacterium]
MKTKFQTLTLTVASLLFAQSGVAMPPPVSATASIPEVPTNLVPWIIGGSAFALIWMRRFFKK